MSGRDGKKTVANNKRWVANVTTDSTHPPPGLFTKSAATIARTLASKEVSPKGPVSGLRMLTYFMNRAGRGLSDSRRAELQKAKILLSKRVEKAKQAKAAKFPCDLARFEARIEEGSQQAGTIPPGKTGSAKRGKRARSAAAPRASNTRKAA